MKGNAITSRWRLVLGRYAEEKMPFSLDRTGKRMDRALEFLYGQEYSGRGVRSKSLKGSREGSLDPSQLTVPAWLKEINTLFPKETIQIIEKHALERYEINELVTNKKTIEKLEPNMDLLKMILSFKGHMNSDVLDAAKRIVKQVVDELKEKLAQDIQHIMSGRLNRNRYSPLEIAQNFDWRRTLQKNLKNYDTNIKKLIIEHAYFFSRVRRQMPWSIILCVDQSGSMLDSVIHSAVMAGIFAGLPFVNMKLVVFDTSVVDLSDQLDDPVEILMSVQLGGGTFIGQAMTYCEQLIEFPKRTVFILVSDFCEGAPPQKMLACTKRMKEAGVKLLGLAALDSDSMPVHDEKMAARLVAQGMEIAALTPKKLAQWLIGVIS